MKIATSSLEILMDRGSTKVTMVLEMAGADEAAILFTDLVEAQTSGLIKFSLVTGEILELQNVRIPE